MHHQNPSDQFLAIMEFVPATQEEVKCHINETNGAEILIAKMHQDSSEIPKTCLQMNNLLQKGKAK